MSEDTWDFKAQHADTADTLDHLAKDENLPIGKDEIVNLDVFLVPGVDADQLALERALAMFAYSGEVSEDDDGNTTFVVTVPETEMSLDGIWLHEERITKIALTRGYTPDGWGFWEP